MITNASHPTVGQMSKSGRLGSGAMCDGRYRTGQSVAVRDFVDPSSIVGAILDARVGWHVIENVRSPVLVHLEIGGQWLEACTPGDGSLRLSRAERPTDFDMDDSGAFVFAPPRPDHPVASLIGRRIERVQRLIWMGTDVGLILVGGDDVVVLANEGTRSSRRVVLFRPTTSMRAN